MGYPSLNQLLSLSIWLSSKRFENLILMATYLLGRAVIPKKVGPFEEQTRRRGDGETEEQMRREGDREIGRLRIAN